MKQKKAPLIGRRHKEVDWDRLISKINEAKKDPEFVKDVKRFIRATTR